VQAASRGYGIYCISGLFRPAFLRLEQVDVSAACDVEGVSARTDQALLPAFEREVAVADGAEEHSSSVADGGRRDSGIAEFS